MDNGEKKWSLLISFLRYDPLSQSSKNRSVCAAEGECVCVCALGFVEPGALLLA